MGLGVAAAWWCLALGFGVYCNTPGTEGHWRLERTLAGADQRGLPLHAAAPASSGREDYTIRPVADGFQSHNPGQRLGTCYSGDGFALEVGTGAAMGHASMALLGIGCGARELRPSASPLRQAEGGRLRVDHGSFRMEYENGPQGMRHDVVVKARPEGRGRLAARFQVGGDLQALQTGPGEVVFHRYCPQAMALQPAIRYAGLKAWDASGRVLPAAMELHADELVLAVEDAGAVYPVTIDPLSSTADLELPGSAAGESFGYSVATAGDVNGDGYSDLLVGSPFWNMPFANAGRVQLFLGSATGVSATPAWSFQGTQANARLGLSVSTAGDVNGDGFSDVVIGCPGFMGMGAAMLFKGAATGLGASPDQTIAGQTAGDDFGWSVALAGDVNGDGLSDVLVGAPKYSSSKGKAYCFHGTVNPAVPLVQAWTYAGTAANAQLGYCVAGAGDLNRDGYGDAAIGAPYQPKVPGTNNGAVYLFAGAAGGLNTAAATVQQGAASANFGYSVAAAGDVNGDGFADLIVGAPGTGSGNGAAHLFWGMAAATLINVTAVPNGGASSEQMGWAVASAGDVNGDGFADVLLGSPGASSGKGKVQVFAGDAAFAWDAPHKLISINGSVAAGRFGAAACTAGDVNGDGISDLALAAPDQGGVGAVKIFHGSPEKPAATAQWTVIGGGPYAVGPTCVASAGDVNGDGYSDVLVGTSGGAIGTGSVMLYLGSASGVAATSAWTKSGENVGDLYGLSVASAGDVNGDGYSDVLVGAPGWPNYTWRGKVYLFLGGAGGLAATPAWTGTGEALDARFGFSVASAGDVNGDGYSDVVVGSYNFKSGAINTGKAYAYLGSATGLAAAPNWTAVGESAVNGAFGQSVSLAGDVNGDGYDDLLIGDPMYARPAGAGYDHNIGAAYLYLGSPAGVNAAYEWRTLGEGAGVEYGCSVSFAGDVNNDGYSDVIVGAYRQNAGGKSQAGRAYVYHGTPHYNPDPVPVGDRGGLGAAPATVLEDAVPYDDYHFGLSVCAAGDVNGDGYGDVVVGVPGYSSAKGNQGKAAVFTGSATGVLATEYWAAIKDASSARLNARCGSTVALAGDVNGDGYSDIVVGANEQDASANVYSADAYLAANGRSRPMRTFQFRSNLTTRVRTGNGTFQADCQWGIGQYAYSSTGRGKVKLVWDVFGHGPWNPVPFFNNNSTAFTGQDAAWTDTLPPGPFFKRLLSTAAGATSHPAWRVRVRQHPATALDGRVFGRWFRQGMHDLQVPSIKTSLAGCGPLPVTLVAASVRCEQGRAVLEWATATEQDCAEFIVQRSADASFWQDAGRVPCSGNSTQLRQYRFADAAMPDAGVTYFRLRQVDINGTFALFPAMPFTPCGSQGPLPAWPNPVADELNVLLGEEAAAGVRAVVRDMAGRVVMEREVVAPNGNVGRISGWQTLPPGPYLIDLVSPRSGRLGQVRAMHL